MNFFDLGVIALASHRLSSWMNRVVCFALIFSSIYHNYAHAQQTEPPTGVTTHNRVREDGTALSLEGSNLHLDQPLVGEKAEFPAFSREMIQVGWRSNDPIELYVIRPRGVQKPRPILYLYSYPSETNRFLDNRYCERITKGGYAAIGFVSALTGQRYHDRPMREWFVSEMQEALTNSVHDVQEILNYLSSRGDFDLTEVGMFGQGSGGAIAILAAAADSRIHALDLLEPWGDWPDWLAKSTLVPEEERPSYLKPEFLARLAPLDPVHWLPELKTQAIRLQFVTDNSVTPLVVRERLASVAPATAHVVRYQDTRELYQATGGGGLFDWIKGELKYPPTALPQSAHSAGTVSAGERGDP